MGGVGSHADDLHQVAKFPAIVAIAERYPDVFCTVGTHPHNAGEEPDVSVSDLIGLSRHPRCVGIGEAGLDYHYDRAPRDVAKAVLRTHIAAARDTGLPLVIHSRDCDEDMIAILEQNMPPARSRPCCIASAPVRSWRGQGSDWGSSSPSRASSPSASQTNCGPSRPRCRSTGCSSRRTRPTWPPMPFRGKRNEPAMWFKQQRFLPRQRVCRRSGCRLSRPRNFFRLFDKAVRPAERAA